MTLFPTEMELLDIHTHHLPEVPGTALYCLNEGETGPVGHFCSAFIRGMSLRIMPDSAPGSGKWRQMLMSWLSER